MASQAKPFEKNTRPNQISLFKAVLMLIGFSFLQQAFAERTYHYFLGNNGYRVDGVFSTPDDLGETLCPGRYNNPYSRVEPNPNFEEPGASNRIIWGNLYCDIGGGQEQGVGAIFTIICPDYAGQLWFAPYFQCPPQDDDPGVNDGCTKKKGDPKTGVGNPCNVATGNKFQRETDFSINSLSFSRAYNSVNLVDRGLGKGWRSNHQKNLSIDRNSLVLVSSTGRGEPWTKVGNVWQGNADSDFIVTQDARGFYKVTNNDGSFEDYNRNGQLIAVTDTNGAVTNYIYNTNSRLITVTNHYGHELTLSYTDGKLSSVTDPLGAIYRYEYDIHDNLIAVIFPDATPANATDNPRRIYHYERTTDFPNHLTGITDENGVRFSTYAYDQTGKAISTEYARTTNASGQEKFELDFQ